MYAGPGHPLDVPTGRDLLEIINIQKRNRKRGPVAFRPFELLIDVLYEISSIISLGQIVSVT